MVHISTPVPRLCLSFEFDLDGGMVRQSNEIHDAAIKEAAKAVDGIVNFSQYGVTPDAFSAKVIDGTEINLDHPLNISTTHNTSFDPKFHVAYGGPAIRYEFIYSDIHPNDSTTQSSKLFLRIVTSFGKPNEAIDGVTATRIGLSALEILDGNQVHPTIFPHHPPPPVGIRLIQKFIYHMIINGLFAIPIGYMQFYISSLFEQLGLKKKGDIFRVNNAVSLLKYHASKYGNDNANYRIYRSEVKGAFRTLLQVAEKWNKSLGLDGYFYLINSSPYALAAITSNIQDLTNVETRNRGAFVPPGPPPSEGIWNIINFALADKMVINNYGAHKHNFTAKPVAFIWDWLDIRSTLSVAACISINGVFMGCFRGLESSLDQLEIPEETFQPPPTKAMANSTWRKTMKKVKK